MIIKVLVENTSISDDFANEHGLSLYIETDKHKILFDMGKSDLFIKNAKKLGVDLSQVDFAFISHGHYDHGGGLKYFLEVNDKAKVYVNKNAFKGHYSKHTDGIAYIGLNPDLKCNDRIIFVDKYQRIDDELEIFSDVSGKKLLSLSNKTLYMGDGENFVEDDFSHEQSLIINEGNKTVLIAGCAHNGIVNVTNKFGDLKGKQADYVIGGFHLFNPSTQKTQDPYQIKLIAQDLKEKGSMYYTCHCTGVPAFKMLSEVLKDKIEYINTGSIIEI